MKKSANIFIILLIVLLSACSTPTKIAYFQDASPDKVIKLQSEQMFRLRPEDKINIVVNSKDPSLESLFTLTAGGQRNTLGASSQPRTIAGKNTSGSSYQTIAYTVDSEGYIDFPVLGKIKAAGMTRQELAAYIKNTLIEASLVNDPIVTVEYVNISVSVLGEVKSPGRMEITKDHFTIIDAISQAGDLTINGERENIIVMRTEGDNQKTYMVDLCSAKSLAESPAFYLQQNDVVYVAPNKKRMREATVSGNTVLTPSFWISIASLLTTITALIIR